jgi:hypothetical protein
MAGLGLFNQKSARALAPRGLLRSAYDFLCLIYAKSARASRKVPGQFWPTPGATRKKRFLGPPARLWWWHSLYKNLVKNTKNELLSVNDSGAHFFCVQYRIWRRWRWEWPRRLHFFGQTSPTQPYIELSTAGFIWTPNWLLGTRARPGSEERAKR